MKAQAGALILIGLILLGLGVFWALHLLGYLSVLSIPRITDYDLYISLGVCGLGILLVLIGKHIW